MPGVNGRELAERTLELRPGMKVLFMSGYTEDEDVVLRHGVVEKELNFLAKPYSLRSLGAKIQEVLG